MISAHSRSFDTNQTNIEMFPFYNLSVVTNFESGFRSVMDLIQWPTDRVYSDYTYTAPYSMGNYTYTGPYTLNKKRFISLVLRTREIKRFLFNS